MHKRAAAQRHCAMRGGCGVRPGSTLEPRVCLPHCTHRGIALLHLPSEGRSASATSCSPQRHYISILSLSHTTSPLPLPPSTSLFLTLSLPSIPPPFQQVGFNMKKITKGGVTIKMWDLGGQPRFRSLWERYCRGVQAIVFVVDAADFDGLEVRGGREGVRRRKERERNGWQRPVTRRGVRGTPGAPLLPPSSLPSSPQPQAFLLPSPPLNPQASRTELHALLEKPSLRGTPLLVLGNKSDLAGALGTQQLIDRLGLKVRENRGKGRQHEGGGSCCGSISCQSMLKGQRAACPDPPPLPPSRVCLSARCVCTASAASGRPTSTSHWNGSPGMPKHEAGAGRGSMKARRNPRSGRGKARGREGRSWACTKA